MFSIDDILKINTEEDFGRAALEIFAFQASACAPYREYLSLSGIDPAKIARADEIPFIPVELFKTHKVYCGEAEPEAVFTSSSTGGGSVSRHYMADLSAYEKTFLTAFEHFYGPVNGWSIYALLPSYLERTGSSLVYMADRLIRFSKLPERRNGAESAQFPERGGGFYLDNYGELMDDMGNDPRRKILLGVSYALWELAEKYPAKLSDTVIMETGGMKGRREELPREEFHKILCSAFGVDEIHSEYGMAELSSQAYSCGGGKFSCPGWMKVSVRDLNDPFEILPAGRNGGINVTDLANIHSCAFIQTQDIGRTNADGRFEILGRADRSEIRGCNLLVS